MNNDYCRTCLSSRQATFCGNKPVHETAKMAGAIGLSGIHNVAGICDLCGVKCDPNKEDLNALDCTYKECRPLVYHQSCLEKYLKSIRLEKNRKTGFKCPRGCGKGTRFSEPCRGKVDKSHPIHVRHEQITKPKNETETANNKTMEDRPKKKVNLRTPNVADLNLMKALPSKTEEQNSEWKVSLRRSKSLDKTQKQSLITSQSSETLPRSRSRRSTGNVCFTPTKKGKAARKASCEGSGDGQSKCSNESVRSQLEGTRSGDFEECSSNGSQNHSTISCESPDPSPAPPPKEAKSTNNQKSEITLHENCKRCLIEWKSTMLIKQLYRMGFEMWRANSAVQIFGSNIEEALGWLVQNAGMSHDQVNALIRHHPIAQINIEVEMRTLLHICQKYSIDSSILELAIIRFEGDLNSAIQSLLGNKADEFCFPDFDLSLGIVQSEAPVVQEMSSNRDEAHPETLSDELNLGCVLGSALEDYKRGNADFTDLVSKDLSFYDHTQNTGDVSSPLSPVHPISTYNVQHQHAPFGGSGVYGLGHHGRSLSTGLPTLNYHQYFGSGSMGDPMMSTTTSMELRHFIGDLLE